MLRQPPQLNWLVRYAKIVHLLERENLTQDSILEVGSGPYGISCCFDGIFVGVDIDFPNQPANNMIPLKTNCLHLPFPDASFRTVLSVDNLEHIESAERENAIREMLRVTADYLLITCPCGEVAQRCDEYIYKWLKNNGAPIPNWLQEHRRHGLPTLKEVETLLQKFHVEYTTHPYGNAAIHILSIIAERLPNFPQQFLGFNLVVHRQEWLELLQHTTIGENYRTLFIVRHSKPKAPVFSSNSLNEKEIIRHLRCSECRGPLSVINNSKTDLYCEPCDKLFSKILFGRAIPQEVTSTLCTRIHKLITLENILKGLRNPRKVFPSKWKSTSY